MLLIQKNVNNKFLFILSSIIIIEDFPKIFEKIRKEEIGNKIDYCDGLKQKLDFPSIN